MYECKICKSQHKSKKALKSHAITKKHKENLKLLEKNKVDENVEKDNIKDLEKDNIKDLEKDNIKDLEKDLKMDDNIVVIDENDVIDENVENVENVENDVIDENVENVENVENEENKLKEHLLELKQSHEILTKYISIDDNNINLNNEVDYYKHLLTTIKCLCNMYKL